MYLFENAPIIPTPERPLHEGPVSYVGFVDPEYLRKPLMDKTSTPKIRIQKFITLFDLGHEQPWREEMNIKLPGFDGALDALEIIRCAYLLRDTSVVNNRLTAVIRYGAYQPSSRSLLMHRDAQKVPTAEQYIVAVPNTTIVDDYGPLFPGGVAHTTRHLRHCAPPIGEHDGSPRLHIGALAVPAPTAIKHRSEISG